MLQWDTSELTALAADLGSAGEDVGRKVDQATRAAGMRAVGYAQADAPVDTGYHRSSIGMDVLAPAVVEFGPTSSYAAHLEYGTHKMSPRPHVIPAGDRAGEELAKAVAKIASEALK